MVAHSGHQWTLRGTMVFDVLAHDNNIILYVRLHSSGTSVCPVSVWVYRGFTW